MKIGVLLKLKYGVVGCLFAAGLVAAGCADGPTSPTTPSASVSVSAVAPTARGNQPLGSQAVPLQSSPSAAIERLFLTKTCDAAFPNIPICTVQETEAGPFPVGTAASYTFSVLDFTKRLSAGVVLTTPDGDTATGHCTLSFKTGRGRCTFAKGTGALAGVHANIEVSFDPSSGVTIWDGTYHFAGRD